MFQTFGKIPKKLFRIDLDSQGATLEGLLTYYILRTWAYLLYHEL